MSDAPQASDVVPPWAVIVLTGGGSLRMGQDKATLDVAGATLLDRTLDGIPAAIDVIVAGPPVAVTRAGVRFVQEVPPGGGPVAGIDAALVSVTEPVVVVLGGINGSGKTTSSKKLLADRLALLSFVNADVIALLTERRRRAGA